MTLTPPRHDHAPPDAEDLAVRALERLLRAAAAWSGASEFSLDPVHVRAAIRSERLLRVDGRPLAGFHPLSRFWPTADGWVRTHANYPWHRAALLAALETTPERLGSVLAALPAAEVEERVSAAGGLAIAVRTRAQWRALAGAPAPLLQRESIPGAPPRPPRRLRVLDLTRVIAGPVGSRMLGALGADVLRIDPPGRPELPLHRADGLLAKRSARLDLGDPRVEALLGEADVVLLGYRPGALDRFGLGPETICRRHPGTVVITLSAWGATPGLTGRRGFDSLVQAATGLALTGGDPSGLPCQLLDHSTGYLIAAAALEGVIAQHREGSSHIYCLSLTATAEAVLAGPPARDPPLDPTPYLVRLGAHIRAVSPPGALDGVALAWPGPPARYGAAAAVWQARAPGDAGHPSRPAPYIGQR